MVNFLNQPFAGMKHLVVFVCLLVLFTSCLSDDDSAIPSNFNFQSLGVIDADFLDMGSGMIGSTSENLLYTAHRSQRDGGIEKLTRFNLSDNTVTDRTYPIIDFVTKRIHESGDQLIVVGGSFINTYSKDIFEEPVTVRHGARLTRFGSFTYEDDLYIFGGDLNGEDSDKIKKWNPVDTTFQVVGTLPEPRFWTNGQVVNDHLYIFGGMQVFQGNDFAEDEIYKVDLQDFSIESFRLPEDYNQVFTATIGTNIFVAGQVWKGEDIATRVGVFNTLDNSFREVTFNLNDVDISSIYGLASVGNRLYAIHGDSEEGNFKLMELIL
ncbi:MAG: kelch repeat-containing protein [Cytophagales bacterium]|nr:kelch repeat-containing protein [Cytophagales bacterium]